MLLSQRNKTGLYAIKNDITQIRSNLDRLLNFPNLNSKLALFNDTIKLFSQFDSAEEIVLYTSVKNYLGLGELIEISIEQNILLEKLLYELDQRYDNEIQDVFRFQEDILRLRELVNTHASFIEREMITKLESKLTRADIESINSWYDRVKSLAPTRPHPASPHSTTGKIITGPVLSLVDRFRDLSKQFTKSP